MPEVKDDRQTEMVSRAVYEVETYGSHVSPITWIQSKRQLREVVDPTYSTADRTRETNTVLPTVHKKMAVLKQTNARGMHSSLLLYSFAGIQYDCYTLLVERK
jgi:hypothetical protein